ALRAFERCHRNLSLAPRRGVQNIPVWEGTDHDPLWWSVDYLGGASILRERLSDVPGAHPSVFAPVRVPIRPVGAAGASGASAAHGLEAVCHLPVLRRLGL